MNETHRKFDLVLWGATGFTGQLVAEYLVEQDQLEQLNWAIAGRSEDRLRQLSERLCGTDQSGANPALLTGNARDPARLRSIARRSKVICSTVGPYAKYGTPLVDACVRADTDYCDLTGEAHWMRTMIDRFHEEAKEQGTRIVHACGFDAVPSDLGTLMVQEKALETYGVPCEKVRVRVMAEGGSVSGGTAASMMEMFEAAGRDRQVRELLDDPYGLVPGRSEGGFRGADDVSVPDPDRGQAWTVPFPMEMINSKVVHRSNYLLGDPWTRAFSYGESVPVGEGVSGAVASALGTAALKLLEAGLSLAPIRALLKRYVLPEPGQGPDRTTIEEGSFCMSLMGTGNRTEGGPPFHVEGTVLSNRDPGYGSTAVMLGEAALCLAREDVVSPVEGGVLTPATGIGTPLIDRLREAGMDWSVST
jgi:short subunit dehydrogenase-like uncharacterized protein